MPASRQGLLGRLCPGSGRPGPGLCPPTAWSARLRPPRCSKDACGVHPLTTRTAHGVLGDEDWAHLGVTAQCVQWVGRGAAASTFPRPAHGAGAGHGDRARPWRGHRGRAARRPLTPHRPYRPRRERPAGWWPCLALCCPPPSAGASLSGCGVLQVLGLAPRGASWDLGAIARGCSHTHTPSRPQGAHGASMASTAAGSATAPTGAPATGSTAPASATRGCTAASAT